jgi:DNA-binding LacI/PurR family transcriptional regulator
VEGNSITIKDIAKLLGLSKSTVSRALKDHPDISKETRESVKKVAESLGYMPNVVASSLRLKKSKIIGAIFPEISYFFFPSVIHGIEEIAHSMGYNLLIVQSNESYDREVENLNILLSNKVEGILLSVSKETRNFDHFQHVIEKNLPIVFFDRIVKDLPADNVLVDDISGAYKAVNHLIETGRKRIAICNGNPNLLICQNRLKGYKMALEQNGVPINDQLIVCCESPKEAEKETLKLLSLEEPPDAIFAISDLTMTGVMKAIYQKQLSIPGDISVIGFCEEIFRSMYHPSLSAIQPMGFEIGKIAAELLFEKIQRNVDHELPLEPRTIYLESSLVKGDST